MRITPSMASRLQAGFSLMPTSRGSCSGSGVLVTLAVAGKGPAALVFREREDVLTLGTLVASMMFGHLIPVIRLRTDAQAAVAAAQHASIGPEGLVADERAIAVTPGGRQRTRRLGWPGERRPPRTDMTKTEPWRDRATRRSLRQMLLSLKRSPWSRVASNQFPCPC